MICGVEATQGEDVHSSRMRLVQVSQLGSAV
jgi:hypothetical protein